MSELAFHLPVFDGPLDLLLHLIAKNKVNIYDIPVALILDQYMEYLDRMAERDYALTSDFAAMAAQLLYIKSKMLLPVHEEEEEEDPRARLVEMLLEYQRIKDVSGYFEKREGIGRDTFVKRPEPLAPVKDYPYQHTADELLKALRAMTDRQGLKLPPEPAVFSGIVGREPASVRAQLSHIIDRLIAEGTVGFHSLLVSMKSRSELVACFLAVLELSKAGKITLAEAGEDDYLLSPADLSEEARFEDQSEEAFY